MYKIYQIINIDGQRYIGSTIEELKDRLRKHKADHNRIKGQNIRSKIVMDKPHTIILIETLGTDKQQALRRERYWIENLNNVVNKTRPVITKQEKLLKTIEWTKQRRKYEQSWGGELRAYNNCLLLIDPKLFV